MSYILDALKKSESERQRQNTPGFADVPAQAPRSGMPAWVWLLLGLLLINAVVLGGFLLRSIFSSPAASVPAVVSQPLSPPAAVRAEQSNTMPARETRAAAPVAPPTPDAKKTPVVRTPVRTAAKNSATVVDKAPAARPPTDSATLPTLLDLSAEGVLQLPELHLDVHVYSQAPQDRFVFINMSKYREAARLADGPMVREIVPDGVILEYDGNTFLLPRD